MPVLAVRSLRGVYRGALAVLGLAALTATLATETAAQPPPRPAAQPPPSVRERPLVVVGHTGEVSVTDGIDSLGGLELGIHATDWGSGYANHSEAVRMRHTPGEGRRIVEGELEVPGSGGKRMEFRESFQVVSDRELRLTIRCHFPDAVSIFGYTLRVKFQVVPLIGETISVVGMPESTMQVPVTVGEPIMYVGSGRVVRVAPGNPAGLTISLPEDMSILIQDDRAWAGDVLEARLNFREGSERTTVPAGETLERTFTIEYNRPMDFALDENQPDRPDRTRWFPYALSADGPAVDLSFLNEKPAGKHGFVRAADGRLRFADGTPARFWGTYLWCLGGFPDRTGAERTARRLAATGVNLAAIHHAGFLGQSPLLAEPRISGKLEPASLDRLDYLVSCLKREGVYTYLELPVGSGGPGADVLGSSGACQEPEALTRQAELARGLLSHVNPYTKLAYKDEPAIALVEAFKGTNVVDSRVSAEPVRSRLEVRYRQWAAKGGLTVDAGGIDFAAGSPQVVRFLMEAERAHLAATTDSLRKAGLRVPVTASRWGISLPLLVSLAGGDFVMSHSPFDLPAGRFGGVSSRPLACQLGASFTPYAADRLAGKPFLAGLWSGGWPEEWRAENALAAASLGSLQGWDGVVLGATSAASDPPAAMRPGDHLLDPASVGPALHAALMFRRGDASEAVEHLTVVVPEQQMLENPGRGPWEIPALLGNPVLHGVHVSVGEAPRYAGRTIKPEDDLRPRQGGTLASDTGELRHDTAHAVVVVDTPRTQAVCGLLGRAGEVRTADTQMRVRTAYATIAASSLTRQPIAASDRVLLTAVGRAENTGATFNASHSRLLAPGTAPVLAEPIDADVRIRVPAGRSVRPILADGKRGAALKTAYGGGWLSFRIGAADRTVHYEIAK